jgi:tetratricopeptide (TPR) repeat protein
MVHTTSAKKTNPVIHSPQAQGVKLNEKSEGVPDNTEGKHHTEVSSQGEEWENLADEMNSLLQNRQQDRALDLIKQALNDAETTAGPDHPSVAIRLNMLGELYYNLGQKAQAESLYQRALEIDEKALGTNHPDVAISLNNLAVLYGSQGKYAQAEPLSKRALEIDEKALGSDHPKVATDLKNLAALYYSQRQYAQAEPLFRRALAIRERVLGPDHIDMAEILKNMAALYRATNRQKEAAGFTERAENIQREDSIRRLGGSPLRCQFSLKGVSIKQLFFTEWGDLFACENGLIYIFLSSNAGKVTIGGRMEDTSFNEQKRVEDFGMSIEERIRKHGGKVILKEDVTSINFQAGNIGFSIDHNGEKTTLLHQDASKCYQILESWRQGTLKDEVDTQGANLRFPPIARLLHWLGDGSICNEVEPHILGEIPAQTVYMQAIFSLFEKLKRQEQEAVLKSLFDLPKDWVDAFRIYLEKRRIDAQRFFPWSLGGFFLSAIGAIYFLVKTLAQVQEMTGSVILSLICWVFLFIFLYSVWHTRKEMRESKHLLPLVNTPR